MESTAQKIRAKNRRHGRTTHLWYNPWDRALPRRLGIVLLAIGICLALLVIVLFGTWLLWPSRHVPAVEPEPDRTPALTEAYTLRLRAKENLSRGKTDEAIQNLEAATSLDPDYGRSFIELALLNLQQRNPEAALEVLERCLSSNPQDDLALGMKAILLSNTGDPVGARNAAQSGLAVSPFSPVCANAMYLIRIRDGERDEVVRELAWKRQLSSAHVIASHVVVQALLKWQEGDREAANLRIRAAERLMPPLPLSILMWADELRPLRDSTGDRDPSGQNPSSGEVSAFQTNGLPNGD